MPVSEPPNPSRRERRDLPWAAAFVLLGALVFWNLLPHEDNVSASVSTARSTECLSNLGRIAQGFALYAADWDGKFPRGKDAEDRAMPESWRRPRPDGTVYFEAVRRAPMLPDLLASYRVPRQAWHCPADVGWNAPSLPGAGPTSLTNVHPSAWSKYGMSYFYLTEVGLRGLRASELGTDAGQTLLLFDGEFWHPDIAGGPSRLSVLFADGHANPATPTEFQTLIRNWSARSR